MEFDEVLELARQPGIAIYTITLRDRIDVAWALTDRGRSLSDGEFAMRALALETGARWFFPSHVDELVSVDGSIADRLAYQYALGYASTNPAHDGRYRRILVRVDEPNARARTRAGYLAAPGAY